MINNIADSKKIGLDRRLLILTIFSLVVNIVNLVLNFSNNGIASIAYIILAVLLLYISQTNKLKEKAVFFAGIIFTACMGLISIAFKYVKLSDNVAALIYYLPIIIMLFLGGRMIGKSFSKRNK